MTKVSCLLQKVENCFLLFPVFDIGGLCCHTSDLRFYVFPFRQSPIESSRNFWFPEKFSWGTYKACRVICVIQIMGKD